MKHTPVLVTSCLRVQSVSILSLKDLSRLESITRSLRRFVTSVFHQEPCRSKPSSFSYEVAVERTLEAIWEFPKMGAL